jgi:hypothetical protein
MQEGLKVTIGSPDDDRETGREQLSPGSTNQCIRPKLSFNLHREDDKLFVNIDLTNDSQSPMILSKTFDRSYFRIMFTSNVQNKSFVEYEHLKANRQLRDDNITIVEPDHSVKYTNIEITRAFRVPFDQVDILTLKMQYFAIYKKTIQVYKSNQFTRTICINKSTNVESRTRHIKMEYQLSDQVSKMIVFIINCKLFFFSLINS